MTHILLYGWIFLFLIVAERSEKVKEFLSSGRGCE